MQKVLLLLLLLAMGKAEYQGNMFVSIDPNTYLYNTKNNKNYPLTLKPSVTTPSLTDIYLDDQEQQNYHKLFTAPAILVNHPHPSEYRQNNIYLLQQATKNIELWRYDRAGKGIKLYTGKTVDFRVARNNQQIAVSTGNSLAILNTKGKTLKVISPKPTEQIVLFDWSTDSAKLWYGVKSNNKFTNIIRIETNSWKKSLFPVNYLAIGKEYAFNPDLGKIVFSDAGYPYKTQKRYRVTTLYLYQTANSSIELIATANKTFSPRWKDNDYFEFISPLGTAWVTFNGTK